MQRGEMSTGYRMFADSLVPDVLEHRPEVCSPTALLLLSRCPASTGTRRPHFLPLPCTQPIICPPLFLLAALISIFHNTHPDIILYRCFDDCISDFTSKAVSTKEEACVNKCVEKFLKTSERLGQRFAEQNQAMGGTSIGK